jgi:hypothetical protein
MPDSPISPIKLSQWEALQLESLKAYGWSAEELIRNVHEGVLPRDNSKFQFNYVDLAAFASEHPDSFELAVKEGYQIKYNTIRGIHSWILVALGQEAELALEAGGEHVVAHLTAEEAARLAAALSFGWKASLQSDAPATSDKAVYRIAPAGRE